MIMITIMHHVDINKNYVGGLFPTRPQGGINVKKKRKKV